jgi:O-antigen/teichoic acid export membrane protein
MTDDGSSGARDDAIPAEDVEVALKRAPIRRNIQHMLSSQLVSWGLATALAIIVPRWLGPESQGDLRLAWSLWLIAGVVLGLGTAMYVQLEIARRPTAGLTLVGPVMVIRSAAWFVVAAAILAYTALTESTLDFTALVALIGLGVLITAWSDVFGAAFVGLERMSVISLVGVESKLVNAVAVIGLLWIGAGVWGVVSGSIAAAVWSLVRLGLKYRRVGKVVFEGWTHRWRAIARASSPYMMAGTGIVVYQQVDVIVLSWFASSRDIGWYSTAETLAGSVLFPATVVFAAIFPTLGRLHEHDQAALVELVKRTFGLFVLVAVPIGLGIMVVGPSFAPLLYGEEFKETGDVLVALGPMIMLNFGTILFGGVALATERGAFWVKVVFTAAVLTVPLDLLVVPWAIEQFDNGAIGGAITFGITETFQFAIGMWVIAPYLAQRSVLWRACRALCAGAVMVACTWPVRDLFIAVPIGVGFVSYVAAVLLLRVISDDELRMIREMLHRQTGAV